MLQRAGSYGTPKLWKIVVVEAVVAEQQLVDRAQELAALRAPDDPVVVGARERDDLADAEPGDGVRVGALVLGRVRRSCRRR